MTHANSLSTTPRKRRITVAYEAPNAESVLVTGSFCDWDTTQKRLLKKDRNGVWKKTLTLTPGDYEYRFVVDGEWYNDPACNERKPNIFGTENCVLHVSS